MSNCMIASTKGHDELYEKKVSVCNEHRFYSLEHDLFGRFQLLERENNSICIGKEHHEQEVQVPFDLDLKTEQHQVEIKGNWNNWTHGYNMAQ